MIDRIFNRTIFLWASAIAITLFTVNPGMALLQRVNNMNEAYINCLKNENCADTKAINEARVYYMILSQLYPDYGRGAEMEGVCFLLLKQDRLAIKEFQEAIKHNPNLFWVSFELGKAFYREGHYAQALKCFQAILSQDDRTLFRKATLSTLRRLPEKTREALMLGLVDFIAKIKLGSYQMAIGCLIHQGNLIQAKSIIDLGLGNPQFRQNGFFILANRSWWEDDSRKAMLVRIDSTAYNKPVLHPWSYFIQPLKEVLYQ